MQAGFLFSVKTLREREMNYDAELHRRLHKYWRAGLFGSTSEASVQGKPNFSRKFNPFPSQMSQDLFFLRMWPCTLKFSVPKMHIKTKPRLKKKLTRRKFTNCIQYTIDKTYVFDSSRTAIFPTEVHQGIFTLINIHQSLSFIRSNSCSFQRHFSSTKFDEVLWRWSPWMPE